MASSSRPKKKKEKWAVLLKDSEEKYHHVLHLFQTLKQEQVELRTRDTVLEQIVEGMSVLCGSSTDDDTASHSADSGCSGLHMQDTAVSAGAAGQPQSSTWNSSLARNMNSRRSPASSTPGSSRERLPAVTESVVQDLEARIQQQLALANAASSRGAKFPATQLMRVLVESLPAYQAIATADAVIARLNVLAGRCALLLLHEPDDSAAWDIWQSLTDLHTPWVLADGTESCRPSSSDSHHAPLPAASQSENVLVTDSADCASKVSDHAAHATSSEMALSDSASKCQHPAVEFMLLVLSSLVLDDNSLFRVLSSTNLESKQCPYSATPEHWVKAAQKLQLSTDQVAVLSCMRQVISSSLDPLFSNLRQVAQQQGAQAQEHWGQLLHLYQFPEHHGPAVQVSLKQGQAAHEDSLGQQEQLLQQWKLLGLQQGLVTVNCLSLKQMTTLIAASFPCIPRIDYILSAVKDLSAVQQQQRQQHKPSSTGASVQLY